MSLCLRSLDARFASEEKSSVEANPRDGFLKFWLK
jgi:hypothetical protein